MTTIDKKEANVLNKLNRNIDKLEITLKKMGETDNKLKEFYEQEKAIHEMKGIIKKAKKIEGLVNEEALVAVDDVIYEMEEEYDLTQEIAKEFDKLEKNLATIDETDSKLKSFIAQKEALHETKKILKKAQNIEKI